MHMPEDMDLLCWFCSMWGCFPHVQRRVISSTSICCPLLEEKETFSKRKGKTFCPQRDILSNLNREGWSSKEGYINCHIKIQNKDIGANIHSVQSGFKIILIVCKNKVFKKRTIVIFFNLITHYWKIETSRKQGHFCFAWRIWTRVSCLVQWWVNR